MTTTALDPPFLPSIGFNPVESDADAGMLGHFWLPSRPDPHREPDLCGHWSEMFWPPPTFVLAKPKPIPYRMSVLGWVMPRHYVPKSLRRPSRTESSKNWSGAYILPRLGHRFTRIVGRWTAPTLQTGIVSPDCDPLPFQCSVWIGLDGKKQWTKSLPQVGSAHTIALDGTSQTQKLWWQWWERDGHSQPYEISGVPIRPGDVILCSLSVVTSTLVRVHVINRTRGVFATLALCGSCPLEGSTAEWILERPADPNNRRKEVGGVRLFPMPDYGALLIERCVAEHYPLRTTSLQTPRLIRMTESFSNPPSVKIISAPHYLTESPSNVRLIYGGR